jgi:hypothetical protein
MMHASERRMRRELEKKGEKGSKDKKKLKRREN